MPFLGNRLPSERREASTSKHRMSQSRDLPLTPQSDRGLKISAPRQGICNQAVTDFFMSNTRYQSVAIRRTAGTRVTSKRISPRHFRVEPQ